MANRRSSRVKRCCGVDQTLFARALSIVVLVGQGAVLDYFLIDGGKVSSYAWIILDVLAAVVWISLLIRPDFLKIAGQELRSCFCRGDQVDGQEPVYHHVVLNSMWFAWLFYSIVSLTPRISYVYYSVAPDLSEANDAGPNLLKVGVSLTPVLFLCLATAHEMPADASTHLNLYLERVTVGVVLDLLDTGEFLDVFFTEDQRVGDGERAGAEFKLSTRLAIAILVFAVINMIIPTLGLIELEKKRSTILQHSRRDQRWSNAKIFYLWARLLLVNTPFFVIRCVLWLQHDRQVSVLIVKNAILVVLDAQDLWEFYVGEHTPTLLSSVSTEGGGTELNSMEVLRSPSAKDSDNSIGETTLSSKAPGEPPREETV